ncbi:hypothetical protein [Xanthomonas oryzae]|uniref:Uncharacterized protein n=2 Tax=Xanthomonas oryzae TaxID=347 RepID=A0AAJ6GY52_9XANT|nr:hypothetical protein [Xanthomonas oryzae]QBG88381.1 hypothetical protein EYC54_12450 [Xanthomonas oryzae]QBH03844.1 hypothetical protein EYC57_11135 [Xanthomonas oryzae]WIX08334.1 hypothetical protein QN060_10490 [Xanthomonas oryzae pv. oryzae]
MRAWVDLLAAQISSAVSDARQEREGDMCRFLRILRLPPTAIAHSLREPYLHCGVKANPLTHRAQLATSARVRIGHCVPLIKRRG